MTAATFLLVIAAWCNVPGQTAKQVRQCRIEIIDCMTYLKRNTDENPDERIQACISSDIAWTRKHRR